LTWTDPERFFRERSDLASELDNLAREVAAALQVAPDGKHAPRVRGSMETGRERPVILEVGTRSINGHRVTVQRKRRPFAIALEKR
jgi:hypothetical protein